MPRQVEMATYCGKEYLIRSVYLYRYNNLCILIFVLLYFRSLSTGKLQVFSVGFIWLTQVIFQERSR